MSEGRPPFLLSAAKTLARARSRGLAEAGLSLWIGTRQAIASEGLLKVMVRGAGGKASERAGLVFGEATEADATRYARDIGTDSPGTFRRRLSPWTRCFVVVEGSKLVHASWVTTSRAWTGEIRGYISPPVGDAYIYESFTRAEMRGRGIYPFALQCICGDLGAQGMGRAWIAASSDNVPSLRAISKVGFEDGYEVAFSRRLGRVRIGAPRGPLAEQGRTMISGTARV